MGGHQAGRDLAAQGRPRHGEREGPRQRGAAMNAGRRIHYQCKRCKALVHAVVGRGCGGRACVAGQWKPQRFWGGQMSKIEGMVEAGSAPIVAGAVDAGSARSYVLSERDAWAVVLDALRQIP